MTRRRNKPAQQPLSPSQIDIIRKINGISTSIIFLAPELNTIATLKGNVLLVSEDHMKILSSAIERAYSALTIIEGGNRRNKLDKVHTDLQKEVDDFSAFMISFITKMDSLYPADIDLLFYKVVIYQKAITYFRKAFYLKETELVLQRNQTERNKPEVITELLTKLHEAGGKYHYVTSKFGFFLNTYSLDTIPAMEKITQFSYSNNSEKRFNDFRQHMYKILNQTTPKALDDLLNAFNNQLERTHINKSADEFWAEFTSKDNSSNPDLDLGVTLIDISRLILVISRKDRVLELTPTLLKQIGRFYALLQKKDLPIKEMMIPMLYTNLIIIDDLLINSVYNKDEYSFENFETTPIAYKVSVLQALRFNLAIFTIKEKLWKDFFKNSIEVMPSDLYGLGRIEHSINVTAGAILTVENLIRQQPKDTKKITNKPRRTTVSHPEIEVTAEEPAKEAITTRENILENLEVISQTKSGIIFMQFCSDIAKNNFSAAKAKLDSLAHATGEDNLDSEAKFLLKIAHASYAIKEQESRSNIFESSKIDEITKYLDESLAVLKSICPVEKDKELFSHFSFYYENIRDDLDCLKRSIEARKSELEKKEEYHNNPDHLPSTFFGMGIRAFLQNMKETKNQYPELSRLNKNFDSKDLSADQSKIFTDIGRYNYYNPKVTQFKRKAIQDELRVRDAAAKKLDKVIKKLDETFGVTPGREVDGPVVAEKKTELTV